MSRLMSQSRKLHRWFYQRPFSSSFSFFFNSPSVCCAAAAPPSPSIFCNASREAVMTEQNLPSFIAYGSRFVSAALIKRHVWTGRLPRAGGALAKKAQGGLRSVGGHFICLLPSEMVGRVGRCQASLPPPPPATAVDLQRRLRLRRYFF